MVARRGFLSLLPVPRDVDSELDDAWQLSCGQRRQTRPEPGFKAPCLQ